ncbi:uncharacterized protein isoform X2 [Rhodnius prolixus]|uniref:Uncharacterized protein n=2 Tax=Rhodnius prolixus TaxID=13249 RepID=T1IC72_RHOPR
MQLAGSLEAVRLVANSNSFLRHTHGPNYIQSPERFLNHEITNGTGVTTRLGEVLKTKQLVMFIFLTGSHYCESLIFRLNSFFQELALEKQQLEPVVCPLHGELVHHQHHNFFTLHPHNPFIWYLRYWYDMKHVDGGAIVVRRTGELVTKNPLQHIGRYGVHALNLWINK